jgi:hypothetical protein
LNLPLTVLRLIRDTYTEFSTIGRISGALDLEIHTLEPPDLNNDGIPDNEKNQSCIPEGIYMVEWLGAYKTHGDNVWQVSRKDGLPIPGRSGILIHRGNYPADTAGCILLGSQRSENFVGNSISTLERFADAMDRKPFILHIADGRVKRSIRSTIKKA